MTAPRSPLAMGEERFRVLAVFTKVLFAMVAALSVLSIGVPEPYSIWTSWAAVVCIIAAPLSRVLWFGIRWVRRSDYRFAAVAGGVLAMAAIGFLLG